MRRKNERIYLTHINHMLNTRHITNDFLLKRIGMNDLESFEECKKMAIEEWNRRAEE